VNQAARPASGGDRRGPRPGGGGPGRDFKGGRPDLAADIDLEKLIADSLYLDNQAHAVVSRMRDMDSGTRSQLRRLYSAIRRACRATESDRQHQFVMLRARLAYTIARHQLRSLDGWRNCCCRSPARTMRAATSASAICLKPSWRTTNRS
jgi:hypothetical protein